MKTKEAQYFDELRKTMCEKAIVQGGSNMTGTNCDLFTHK
jgi:hypothetical protein